MSDTKFTKGDWHQSHREGADGMYNTEVYDQEGNTICQLAWYAIKEPNGVTRTNREDNANLIKASPKMYREIERDIDWLSRMIATHGADHPMTPMFADMKQGKIMLLAEARGEL